MFEVDEGLISGQNILPDNAIDIDARADPNGGFDRGQVKCIDCVLRYGNVIDEKVGNLEAPYGR